MAYCMQAYVLLPNCKIQYLASYIYVIIKISILINVYNCRWKSVFLKSVHLAIDLEFGILSIIMA